MTTLIAPNTIAAAPVAPASVHAPAWNVDEISAALAGTAAAIRTAVPDTAPAGVRRRADKLARQTAAAGRLLARGRRLDAPPCLRTLELFTSRLAPAAATGDLSTVDMYVRRLSVTLVVLHTWRGHTACLPRTTTD